MRIRSVYPRHRLQHLPAGRALILLLALLCCFSAATAEAPSALYNPDVPPPVPEEHEPSGDDYFTDAVFVGDSMMEHVEVLGLIPTATYIWKIGMSPGSFSHRNFRIKGSSERVSGYDYAASFKPKKLYIWLGANGLDTTNSDRVIKTYETLAEDLTEHFPGVLIYVISPPPTTYKRMTTKDNVPVKRYMYFEEKLRDLAARYNFYYIDMYHLVADENGYMPVKYSLGDGFHLNEKALTLMTDYIRTHTVPYPASAESEINTP